MPKPDYRTIISLSPGATRVTKTLSSVYSSLVGLAVPADNPTTILSAARLNGGLSVSYSGLAVMNSGTIAGGTQPVGVYLLTGATFTNRTSGKITGTSGLRGNVGTDTVVNYGSITGTGTQGHGVLLIAGGSVTNNSGGTIQGTVHGVYSANTGNFTSVTNAGQIASTGAASGVYIYESGAVANLSGGTIVGYNGVQGYKQAIGVTNAGLILANSTVHGTGVLLVAGGTATNLSTGTISGWSGISDPGTSTATIVNYGKILGTVGSTGFAGVLLNNGGAVTNKSGGTIASSNYGVYAQGALTVSNAGSIAGAGNFGVYLGVGGQLVNQSGGAITGGHFGVYVKTGAATVENAGTISETGGTFALRFVGGVANTLLLDPGAVFNGTVTGGNALGSSPVSNLVLTSGASAGTLSGLDTKYIDFAQVTVASGASWTLAGSNTVASQQTLTDSGTLAVSGTLTNDVSIAGPIYLSGGTLVNAAGATITGLPAAIYGATGSGGGTVLNAGVLESSNFTATHTGGIALFAGGFVSNASSGTIAGGGAGVYIANAANTTSSVGTVLNQGHIAGQGTHANGAEIRGSGLVSNASGGTISGSYEGVLFDLQTTAQSDSVINQGLLSSGTGKAGVYFQSNGTLTNLSGGTIAGKQAGIVFGANGILTNQSGGTITGYEAVADLASATLVNAGAIAGNTTSVNGTGIFLDGGSLTNQSSGTISGSFGVQAQASAATIQNAGAIAGNTASGMGIAFIAGGVLTNQSGGTIAGSIGVRGTIAAVSATNAGYIHGSLGTGVALFAGGFVSNAATGTILGGKAGIYIANAANTASSVGTILNQGHIGSQATHANGAEIKGSGLVSNASGGSIVGSYKGVQFDYQTAVQSDTLVNQGLISAGSAGAMGVYFANTGTVSNLSGGTITGKQAGLVFAGSGALTNQIGGTIAGYEAVVDFTSATLVNAGAIAGNATAANGAGVFLDGGKLTNQSGGSISGAYGVHASGAVATIENAGSIQGSTFAVHFAASYANRLIDDPGAAFTGTVTGGNSLGATAVSTLELASGASGGTLSGLGSKYIGFAQVTVDSGASWTLAGSNTVAVHQTLTDSGTVTVIGTLTNNVSIAGPIYLSGGTLVNAAGATITGIPAAIYGQTSGGGGTVLNSGVLESSNFTGTHTGGIALLSGGFVSNASGGIIEGGGVGIVIQNYANTTTNGGTILNSGLIGGVGTHANGAEIAGGGLVSNASGGTITGSSHGVLFDTASATQTESVVNQGLISASGTGTAVYFSNAGTVSNLSGGTISATQTGIALQSGGSATNQSGGSIFGYKAIYATAAATVVNAGTVQGSGSLGAGIDFKSGGMVTNVSGGTISAQYRGIRVAGSIATSIANAGFIGGTGAGGLGIAFAGSANNNLTNQSSGTISGGIRISGSGTAAIVNAGGIGGIGVYSTGATSIANTGSIGSVDFGSGINGSLTNQSGGTITGGVLINALGSIVSSVTIVNAGSISASGSGFGITDQGGTIALANAGRISADTATGTGIFLSLTGTVGTAGIIPILASGAVTNQSGGVIVGFYGIYDENSVTIVNAGSIQGTADAVKFGGTYTDRLIVDPGAVFTGKVDGGNTVGATVVSTLEFASGASAGTIASLGSKYIDFVQTTIDAGARWTLTGTNTLAAGYTLTNAGTLTLFGATLNASNIVNDGGIVLDPSTMVVGSLTGTGTVTIAAGGTLEVQGTVSSGETIVFDGAGAYLHIDTPASFSGSIAGFAGTDSIDLKGIAPGSVSYTIGSGVLHDGAGTIALSLTPQVPISATASGDGTDIATLCFCAGTLIRTPSGDVPVQNLKEGDIVSTFGGGTRPIVWVGVGKVLATRGRRGPSTPVIVRKGALGPNVPVKDLRVTKGHAFYLNDVLIPLEFLVNHRNIVWDDHAQEVDLYHIETDAHDVLIANGAPAESYRDDGNRWLFQNANTGWDLPPLEPFAPVLTGGPIVDEVWRRILDRDAKTHAAPTTVDPDLHLIVDGTRIDAVAHHGARYTFRLPSVPKPVCIASRAAAPAEVGYARDPRRLGVAVTRIMASGGTALRIVKADDPALADGFHGYEPAQGHRWTDGEATIPAALFAGMDGTVELVLCLGGTAQYPDYAQAAA